MLEVSNSHVTCGGLLIDDDFVPVYANIVTGDIAFETPETAEPMLISEVSTTNPLPMTNLASLEDKLRQEEYIGLILFDDGRAIYILNEDQAVMGDLNGIDPKMEIFSIDMNFAYDYDVLEEDDLEL